MSEELLDQAIALAQAGKHQEACELLVQVIATDVHNETAWLLYADALPAGEERIKALEECLHHNPDCDEARERLAALDMAAFFLELLKSRNAHTRHEACEDLLLAKTSSERIVQALEKALQDEDPLVADAAQRALNAEVHQQMLVRLSVERPQRPADLRQEAQRKVTEPQRTASRPSNKALPRFFWGGMVIFLGAIALLSIGFFIGRGTPGLGEPFIRSPTPSPAPSSTPPPTPVNPCTHDIIRKFRATETQKLSYDMTTAGGGIFGGKSVRNVGWEFSGRGEDGCVATLTAEVNGLPTEAFRWYIDTKTGKIGPDNPTAQEFYNLILSYPEFSTLK